MTTSIGTMVKKLDGMRDTCDLTTWQNAFVKSVVQISGNGTDTSKLSDKQVEIVEEIYERHFG